MKISEGRAERLIEQRQGVLLFITVPDQPNSGAAYLYHARTRAFYMLDWSDRDSLSATEFDAALREYDLEKFILAAWAPTSTVPLAKPSRPRQRFRDRRRWRRPYRQVVAPTRVATTVSLRAL